MLDGKILLVHVTAAEDHQWWQQLTSSVDREATSDVATAARAPGTTAIWIWIVVGLQTRAAAVLVAPHPSSVSSNLVLRCTSNRQRAPSPAEQNCTPEKDALVGQ